MLTFATILLLATFPIAFGDALRQLNGPIATLRGGRVHVRWDIFVRDAAVALANGAVLFVAICRNPAVDELTGLAAIVGCGTVAAMSVVNLGTFLLNRDHQLIDLRWNARSHHY